MACIWMVWVYRRLAARTLNHTQLRDTTDLELAWLFFSLLSSAISRCVSNGTKCTYNENDSISQRYRWKCREKTVCERARWSVLLLAINNGTSSGLCWQETGMLMTHLVCRMRECTATYFFMRKMKTKDTGVCRYATIQSTRTVRNGERLCRPNKGTNSMHCRFVLRMRARCNKHNDNMECDRIDLIWARPRCTAWAFPSVRAEATKQHRTHVETKMAFRMNRKLNSINMKLILKQNYIRSLRLLIPFSVNNICQLQSSWARPYAFGLDRTRNAVNEDALTYRRKDRPQTSRSLYVTWNVWFFMRVLIFNGAQYLGNRIKTILQIIEFVMHTEKELDFLLPRVAQPLNGNKNDYLIYLRFRCP